MYREQELARDDRGEGSAGLPSSVRDCQNHFSETTCTPHFCAAKYFGPSGKYGQSKRQATTAKQWAQNSRYAFACKDSSKHNWRHLLSLIHAVSCWKPHDTHIHDSESILDTCKRQYRTGGFLAENNLQELGGYIGNQMSAIPRQVSTVDGATPFGCCLNNLPLLCQQQHKPNSRALQRASRYLGFGSGRTMQELQRTGNGNVNGKSWEQTIGESRDTDGEPRKPVRIARSNSLHGPRAWKAWRRCNKGEETINASLSLVHTFQQTKKQNSITLRSFENPSSPSSSASKPAQCHPCVDVIYRPQCRNGDDIYTWMTLCGCKLQFKCREGIEDCHVLTPKPPFLNMWKVSYCKRLWIWVHH